MHVFAFSWKPYVISKSGVDPLSAPGSGFSGDAPTYQGGRLGIRAGLDAANPWDIVKASARGFRWLVVGRKKRFEDVSYKSSIPNPNLSTPNALKPTAYNGPSYAGGGDGATELRSSSDMRRSRADTHTTEDDRAGLLAHAQAPSPSFHGTPGPYHNDMDGSTDLGATAPLHRFESPPTPSAYGGFDNPGMDTGYHGASSTQAPIGVALGGHDPAWDMWAGAGREDQESLRPPTYRTTDRQH